MAGSGVAVDVLRCVVTDAEREPVTMGQWREHVLANCDDSYSLAHCAVAIYLAEYGAEDESDWDDKIDATFHGLTGFQVGGAKAIARQIWPLFADARDQAAKTRDNFAKFLQQAAEDGTLIVMAGDEQEAPHD